MKKCLLIFIALSVLVTSCTSKYWIPREQFEQEPKHTIFGVTTVDGEKIEIKEGTSLKDNRIVGFSKYFSIPLAEVEMVHVKKFDLSKTTSVLISITREQFEKDPKYVISAVTTVDGKFIEFKEAVPLKDNRIEGTPKVNIALSEVKMVNCLKLDPFKNSLLALGCLGFIALLIVSYGIGQEVNPM